MDKLKEFINKHKSHFDSYEPKMGHEKRFLEKLKANENNKNKPFEWFVLLKVAVVAILVTLSGLYVKDKLFSVVTNKTAEMYEPKNKEFMEAKQYYKTQINVQLSQINSNQNLSDTHKETLMKELVEADDLYKKLQKDLKTMPNDPRIIQAIIQHYQIKLEILNRIVNDLKNLHNVQQLNTKDNEKIEL